ncbi:hypothetical protein F5X98DRAFT_345671 [Xylaria grammica]|nr:hypothetical protein F5X98DRAFT_345671 [Xylaria grammica]
MTSRFLYSIRYTILSTVPTTNSIGKTWYACQTPSHMTSSLGFLGLIIVINSSANGQALVFLSARQALGLQPLDSSILHHYKITCPAINMFLRTQVVPGCQDVITVGRVSRDNIGFSFTRMARCQG